MRRTRRSRLRRRALIALLFTGLLMLAALGIVLRVGQTLAGGRRTSATFAERAVRRLA